ncbi:hypothetical protein C5167_002458 [Papaver somniferum]|uniref:Uncharacterized protein n=1 Tax=Papaver somniferum TaxID=3469 RepID=A0A4Y7L218_PAPSO|nr:hypothetical protein C5167_002458 [Papaver somniferum]
MGYPSFCLPFTDNKFMLFFLGQTSPISSSLFPILFSTTIFRLH